MPKAFSLLRVSRSTAHDIIASALDNVCQLAASFTAWPNENEKLRSSRVFRRACSKDKVIGAIDGCHIKIQRRSPRSIDYMNRKGYFLILHGICDDKGRFFNIFVGPPGRVHDVRLLHTSLFLEKGPRRRQCISCLEILNTLQIIFGILSRIPSKNVEILTQEDFHNNTLLSRGIVMTENALRRMKCRFRCTRVLQNTFADMC
ncbi:putative nuclease HARBI1 [Penaeus vannamei]|uniref:putative nuclease HARBI1 n=1 Tax=Penaeus vannamei TaxID=6689 RepID=UPI00387F4E4B